MLHTTKTNGAKSVFGVVPDSGQVGGARSPESATFWWKVIEDIFQYAFDTFDGADLGWVPSLEQAQQIREHAVVPQVSARRFARYGKRMGIPSTYDPARIQAMFKNWRVYYPFVDQVAVTRALDFHRGAWEGLTMREHRLVVSKLATMFDPWEDTNIIRASPAKNSTRRPLTTTTPRAARWMEFDPKERKVLFDLVQRRKRTDGV